jgi:hypothetical protein
MPDDVIFQKMEDEGIQLADIDRESAWYLLIFKATGIIIGNGAEHMRENSEIIKWLFVNRKAYLKYQADRYKQSDIERIDKQFNNIIDKTIALNVLEQLTGDHDVSKRLKNLGDNYAYPEHGRKPRRKAQDPSRRGRTVVAAADYQIKEFKFIDTNTLSSDELISFICSYMNNRQLKSILLYLTIVKRKLVDEWELNLFRHRVCSRSS